MSALFDRLLDVFWKRSQPSDATMALLTPEWISERLHTRPVMHAPREAVALAEPTHVLVADEPALPLSDDEFAIADTLDHGAQRPIEAHWPDVANASDMAAVKHIGTPASIITIKPDLTPISAEDSTWAEEEDKPPSIEAPSVEQPFADEPPIRPIPRAQPLAEILVEFHAMMRQHFGREEPATAGAGHDILKILKLDESELIATAPGVPAPEHQDVLPVTMKPENDSAAPVTASNPGPHFTALDNVAIDEEEDTAYEHALTAWKDRTVADVILEGECSVRLSNCIAGNQDFFSDWTIGEALKHRSEFTAALMHVRSLGRKTANEALDAIDAFSLDPSREGEEPAKVDASVVVDPLFGLVPANLNSPLGEVLGVKNVSVRLANVAASGQLDGLTVRNFVLDPDAVWARLRDCKNAGRKTAEEAVEFLVGYVESLALPDAEHEASPRTDDTGPERLSTGEWIRQAVASLLPRQVEVLHSRYGLDGGTPQTLKEIAERVHVTRERVRQVEAKALKHLRGDGRSRAAFTRYLDEEKDAQWPALFGPKSTIPDGEISERFRLVDPWFRLAIDIVFEEGRGGYLNANAHKTPMSWFRSSDEAQDRQRFNLVISDILGSYRTPMPLDTLQEIASSVIPSLSMEGDGWAVHDGYIHAGYVGPKARRAGHMHAVARRIARSGIFDIGTLIAEYRSEFPEDECGSRIFEMQANEAPHLFAPLFDGMWLCLDYSSRQVDLLPAPPFERRRVEETHFSDGSLGDRLMKQLVQFGPQRAIDLRRTIIDSAQGSFSKSSVGAVLISNPCFRRAAPGIFGLYTGTSEVPESIDAYLLEDRHCRAYCRARHSGAPQDYYPLWGAAYEMRLAAWAQHHAPTNLYQSLMAVIDPGTWPASTDTVAQFQMLQSSDGRWEIGAERRLPLGHRFLDSGQFLSALTHLVVFGWISWVGVNRATGSKSDNHDAADVLAFFVMTGLVEPEADWQDTHRPTDLARRLFLQARSERHLHGDELDKDQGVFGLLRSALYESPPTASRGWVDAAEFRTAMPAWRSEGISTGKAFGGAQVKQAGINAEESFESDDWEAVFGA